MARTQTMVQLTDELVTRLDEHAARRRVSRSQVIRDAVEAHLDADTDALLSRRIADGYLRTPEDADDSAAVAAARRLLTDPDLPW